MDLSVDVTKARLKIKSSFLKVEGKRGESIDETPLL